MTARRSWPARAAGVLLVTSLAAGIAGMAAGPSWSSLAIQAPLAAAVAVHLLGTARERLWVVPRPVLASLAIAFAGLVAMSAGASQDAGSWRSAVDLVVPMLAFPLATAVALVPDRKRGLLLAIAGILAGVGSYALLQAFGLDATPRASGPGVTRVSGPFFHFSHFAALLALSVPATSAFALFAARRRVRRVAAALTLLLGADLALTLSWDTLMIVTVTCGALLVAWVVVGTGLRRRRGIAAAIVTTTIASAGVGLLAAAPNDAPTYVHSLPALGDHLEGKLRGRLALYASVTNLVAQRPWLGSGPGTFAETYPSVRPANPGPHRFLSERITYAHNDLLHLASVAGAPASIAFLSLWLLILVLPAPAHDLATRTALRAGLVALLASGATDGSLLVVPPLQLLAWTFAGVLHTPATSACASSQRGATEAC